MLRHTSAVPYDAAAGAFLFAHYKFEMDVTSLPWRVAENPRWSSVYYTRGAELATQSKTAIPVGRIDVCTSSATLHVAEYALTVSAYYKSEMNMTSFLLNAAENPRWSSVYCTRGIELAPRLTNATLAERIVIGISSSATLNVVAGVLPNSTHYKFEMDLTSFPLMAAAKPSGYSLFYERVIELATLVTSAGNPSWSSFVYDRGIELAPLISSAGKPSWSSFIYERGIIEPATLPSSATSTKPSPAHCEAFLSTSLIDRVLYGPMTTVLNTLLHYDVKSTRYDWKSIPDHGNFFAYTVLGKTIFFEISFYIGSKSSSYTLPHVVLVVEWSAMMKSTAFSQKVILKQAMNTLRNHEFLFLFSMVRPNESLPLGSCGPRRCIGYSMYADSSGKYSAAGTELRTPSTSTLKYSEYMHSAESKGTTFPVLKHRAEGMRLSETARETMFCLMLLCLGVFIVNTEPLVASPWPLAHCLAHYTNQGQDVSRCCGVCRQAKVNTTSSHSDSLTKCINRDVVTSMRGWLVDSGCTGTKNRGQKVSKCVRSR